MKIIVADDDASQRGYVAGLLHRAGHECILCAGGAEVLTALQQTEAALVVSDVQMPDFDGLKVSRAIRSADYGRYVYVLLITTSGGSGDYVQCLEAGADDFMSKPVDRATLAVRITAAQRILNYDQALQAQTRKLGLAQEQIQRDLAAAGHAQRALLPAAILNSVKGCKIAPLFMPAHHVSGDMFNYFPLSEGRIGFYAADVAGHGVRSALVAVTLGHTLSPDYFANYVVDAGSSELFRPSLLAGVLNQRFTEPDYEDTYFTLIAGVIDCPTNRVHFCQAGHPSPLLINRAGEAEWHGDGGYPIGLVSDAVWTDETVHFDPGSRFIVHSDGITEAASADGEIFGEHRLLTFVTKRRGESVGSLTADLAQEISQWMGGAPMNDDVTMIAIERLGED